MRAALLGVFFALIINIEESYVVGNDFRPTPIPLGKWRPDRVSGRAGTLHETIQTEPPLGIAAVPPHYWEDALRHSVYLTLVRDKIDQLIAKGDVITPDNKSHHASKTIDDQDLWEKIKTAPFDRIKEQEMTSFGDVTIMAKGRLMEESNGFHFIEDEKFSDKCIKDHCGEGIKAFWSVKRVRQRDLETSPGRYHYELTFSVISQIPKKQQKPYEYPIRTFTVHDSTTDRTTEKAQIVNYDYHTQTSRPQRAIWFHKNIVPQQHYRRRQQHGGLDRLFSTLFGDNEPSYEHPNIYKQNPLPSYTQFSNTGHFGNSHSEQYSHVKVPPHPYKSSHAKLSRPPYHGSSVELLQRQGGTDTFSGISNPYVTLKDHKATSLNNAIKTTHPPVLPTPLPTVSSSQQDMPLKFTNSIKLGSMGNATYTPESTTVYKQTNKVKNTPVKVSYFSEHLRPPVYNAPPGVFSAVDKKQFKPMPPLKQSIPKPLRHHRPIDFRPSPQVLDVQFSEPDPLSDSAFRPITVNYMDSSNSTEKTVVAEKPRKPTPIHKKPQDKHHSKKPQEITTNMPDIITAQNIPEDNDDIEWADILGMFSKTTPMASQKEKNRLINETTATPLTTTASISTTKKTTTSTVQVTTTSTTTKPKKRTRPPQKLPKLEKVKKHKRITTKTTSTTSPLTTKETMEIENDAKPTKDLIPQASSTLVGMTKPQWEIPNKFTSTSSTTSTTTSTSTMANPTFTTKVATTSNPVINSSMNLKTIQPKNKNRFRQSTLILKGTSLKHDRWSITTSPVPDKIRTTSTRRRGSNFQGHTTLAPKHLDAKFKNDDHIFVTSTLDTITTPARIEKITSKTTHVITSAISPNVEENEGITYYPEKSFMEKNHEKYEESKDHSEYIFQQIKNEINDSEETFTTENSVITSPHATPKNKTKCKKKHQNLITKQKNKTVDVENPSTNAPTTNKPLTTPDIFEDLLNDFSFEDTNITTPKPELEKEQIQSSKQYENVDEEIQELLESLNNDKYTELIEENYEDNDEEKETYSEEDEDTEFNLGDESLRRSNDDYDDYDDDKKHPYTLLELMAME